MNILPYSEDPFDGKNLLFHDQILLVGLSAIFAAFTDRALLLSSESRMLRKIQKREKVSIACSDEPKVERRGFISRGKVHATRSELCVEHKAFCKAYVALSKGAHSSPSKGFAVLFKLWIIYFDTVTGILPYSLQVAVHTYEPLVSLRLLVAFSVFRVLGAWPFPSSRKMQYSCTRLGQSRSRAKVLAFLSMFLLCGVYTLSIFAYGAEIYAVTETTRRGFNFLRISLIGSQTLLHLFMYARGERSATSVARKILKCQGKLPEGSAPDQAFNEVRSTCFDQAPVWYPPSAIEWIEMTSDALIFATNALAWGSWKFPLSADGIICQALAIDLILEPLVSQIYHHTV